jgi:hypothetical protein
MPVPFVACKNEELGAFADLPETAIPHMRGWVPVDQDEPAQDEPEASTSTPGSEVDTTPEPAARTPKSKAAPSATTDKE